MVVFSRHPLTLKRKLKRKQTKLSIIRHSIINIVRICIFCSLERDTSPPHYPQAHSQGICDGRMECDVAYGFLALIVILQIYDIKIWMAPHVRRGTELI